MISSDTILFFAILGLGRLVPWILRRRAPDPTVRPPSPPSNLDRAISTLLVIYILWQLVFALWMTPFNFLTLVQSSPRDPSFVFRNKYNSYISTSVSITDGFWEKKEIYDYYYERLRTNENRQLYWWVGHDAFMGCHWCKQPVDYSLFVLPTIFGSYILFAIVMGIATIATKKHFWRTYGVICIVIAGFLDVSVFGFQDVMAAFFGSSHSIPVYDVADYYRRLVFTVMAVLIFFFEQKEVWTEIELLDGIANVAVNMLLQSKINRVTQAVVMGNPNTRATYLSHYAKQFAHKLGIVRSKDYNDFIKKCRHGLNTEKMYSEALQDEVNVNGNVNGSEGEGTQQPDGAREDDNHHDEAIPVDTTQTNPASTKKDA